MQPGGEARERLNFLERREGGPQRIGFGLRK